MKKVKSYFVILLLFFSIVGTNLTINEGNIKKVSAKLFPYTIYISIPEAYEEINMGENVSIPIDVYLGDRNGNPILIEGIVKYYGFEATIGDFESFEVQSESGRSSNVLNIRGEDLNNVGSVTITVTIVDTYGGDYVGESKEISLAVVKEDIDWEYEFVDGGVEITGYKGKETQISIPSQIDGRTVVSIGDYAFMSLQNLVKVNIPNTVRGIEIGAFLGCEGLSSIELPEGLQKIGDDAFTYCNKIVFIEIPESVVSIGRNPFAYCKNLERIKVKEGNTRYDSRNECNALIETDVNILIAGGSKTSIPNTVTTIGLLAFSGCEKLVNIEIPSSVTYIEAVAFAGCTSLTSIVIPESVNYMDKDGTIFDGCPSNLVIYAPENSYAAQYAVQYGITTMPEKTVTVTPTPAPSVVEKEEQYITADSIQKEYGSKPFYLDAETDGDGELSFESSNENVATISWSGKVSIKNYGKSTITIWADETDSYYDATEEITITVVPKKASITKVSSPAKRQVSFTWKKDSSVTGYQIECSPSKSFGKETIQRVIGGKKNTTKTPPLLKSGKKYYVRVRAYKKVGTKKYYGKWSKVKSVKVK